MSLRADAHTLYQLVFRRTEGDSHAERLESFYQRQAAHYDSFRERLLWGRKELIHALPFQPDHTWIDFGGGTASNVEKLAATHFDPNSMARIDIVDLSASLLDVAARKKAQLNWKSVHLHTADATTFGADRSADIVTFSYSLTMIPAWWLALENARRVLKPGGVIGIVDFFVPHALEEKNWVSRAFWPTWFAFDGVYLSPNHIPYLDSRFSRVHLQTHRHRLPYLPLKAPCYTYVGHLPG